MGELYLCSVDAGYLKYLHKVDNRVSVKFNNRPFVGVITIIDDKHYLIPLTSQTTEERKIYRTRLEGEDNFLNVFCCDFTVLEEACEKFDRSNN